MDYSLHNIPSRTSDERFDVIVVNDGGEDKLQQKAYSLMNYLLSHTYDDVKNGTVII
jgi:hypothetical protein